MCIRDRRQGPAAAAGERRQRRSAGPGLRGRATGHPRNGPRSAVRRTQRSSCLLYTSPSPRDA
eukprot:8690250-Lingulodinium_polyedra.AAC.1